MKTVVPVLLVLAFSAQTSGPAATAPVRPGIETFLSDLPTAVRGKRLGLITNHSAIDRSKVSDIDLIAQHKDVKLVALLAPEHGIRGDAPAGAKIQDETDPKTGIPVFSLYLAEDRGPTPEMLKDVDVLVYDLQEVGGRTWTYVSTMALSMQAAAKKKIPFVVLDRPNPIGGEIVEGALLDPKFKSFVGMYPIPARHGMTVGELATLFNQKYGIGADLIVARVANWQRAQWFDQTGLPWVNPSPNLRSLAALTSYPGSVYFEGTNVTEGRGTDRPFEQVGASWLKAADVVKVMNDMRLPGIRFEAITMPVAATAGKFAGQTIPAIRFVITDRQAYRPVRSSLLLIDEIHRQHPRDFAWGRSIDRLAGSDKVRLAIDEGRLPALLEEWDREAADFSESRKPYLLYPSSQQLPPGYLDPQPILEAAAKAIGTDSLKCVTISGTAYGGAVGQQRESAWNVDWPRIDALANYTRTMNWDTRTMVEEFDRQPGLNPASWKYGLGWIDGPLQQERHQTFVVSGRHAWHMDGAKNSPMAVAPELAEIYELEMWLNPHGFLKAARRPGANPKATWRWELGEMGRDGPEVKPAKVSVVSITFDGKYRVDATINQQSMLQRIHTWVAEPVLGDMNYEHEFTNESYVDLGNGVRFPGEWHSHHGWDDNYGAQNVSAGHNAFGGSLKSIRANQCPATPTVPESVVKATFPVRVEVEKLADGVYLIGGGSHNSVAIEFKDVIAVFEAPLDESRSLAVIDAIVKLIPDKPIRWVINSHQHFDHVGGLRTYMHIGATVITHWKNYDFYNRDILNYGQRTLKPDMLSLWPPTELAEGYYYEAIRENFIISDGSRNLNVHYVNPLGHVEGMLIAYLPKEKLLFEADLFDTNQPRPQAMTRDQQSFYAAVTRLGLDVARIVPVHGKPVPWSDFASLRETARGSGREK